MDPNDGGAGAKAPPARDADGSADPSAEEMTALQGVLASPRDCVKILTLDGRISYMSEGGLRTLGLTELSEVRGAQFVGFWRGEDARAAAAAIERAREGGVGGYQAMLDPAVMPARIWWDVEVSPIVGADGLPRSLLAICRNITELKTAEAARARAQENLNLALMAPATVGVWRWDFATDTIYANASLSRAFGKEPAFGEAGIPRKALAGWRRSGDPQPQLGEFRRRLELGQEEPSREFSAVTADGQTRWFLSLRSPDRNADGRIVGLKGVAVDITERRQQEARQALLLAELDHRVKNTLAMVEAIVSQSLREDRPLAEIRATVLNRLHALSRVQDMFAGADGAGADLGSLIAEALAANPAPGDPPPCVEVEGPPVTLGPDAAVCFSIALQELSADAVRHGALSCPGGRLSVRWVIDDAEAGPSLRLTWREQAPNPAEPPTDEGFGSRVVARAFTRLGGFARLEHDEWGRIFSFVAPLARLGAG